MKARNVICTICAIITAVAAVAGIAYLVYRFIEERKYMCDDMDNCFEGDCCDEQCICCDEADDGEIEQ